MEELKSFPTMLIESITGKEVSDYFVMLPIIMVLSIVALYLLTRKLRVEKPGFVQQFLEVVVESFESLLGLLDFLLQTLFIGKCELVLGCNNLVG